jgi:hypothetical protein
VLVERLVGGGPPSGELGRRRAVLGGEAGVVVGDLVVVPHHDERERRVRRLQVGIELVERVAEPVGAQVHRLLFEARDRFGPVRPANEVLVRVVAEMQHEIEVVANHVPIRRVIPARMVLAGGHREGQLVRPAIAIRSGAEVADGALFAARVELEEVVGTGPQPPDLDVHRVSELR